MQILYGFSNCTDKKYDELMKGKNISVMRPDQKYHGLLIKGLSSNGADVKCFSGLPVNRELTKKILIREKDETENGVYYHYISTLNFPVLRRITVFFGSFFGVLKTKKRADTFVICDCLNVANAYGMALAARLKKIPVVTIVTDIPDTMYSGVAKKIANSFFKLVDGFVLLTDAMNDRVNMKNKPYIVLEGHIDAAMPKPGTAPEANTETDIKKIIYAGKVEKSYGIDRLVEGFILANIRNSQLIIYGDGDYAEKLKELCKKHNNVEYMGVRKNLEVANAEQSADLLVNPMPAACEYAKYSFPLKNMEYMASGTPVMTTKLPGMPKEYYPYVYLIEDETPAGICGALRSVFSLPLSERLKKGSSAQKFVLENKSNIKQAGKIIDFLIEKIKA